MNEELKKVMEIAEVWTREPFDAETRAQVTNSSMLSIVPSNSAPEDSVVSWDRVPTV